jgi:hypothetical protein
VAGGSYVDVTQATQDNTNVNTVSLRVQNLGGTHLRINQATNTVEAVPLVFKSPQSIVNATVSEAADSTAVTLLAGGDLFSRPAFVCRAFVVFSAKKNAAGSDDTTTMTNRFIYNRGNVSSVQRSGVGVYNVYFTTPMETSKYTVLITGSTESAVSVRTITSNHTVTFCQVNLTNTTQTTGSDIAEYVNVAVFE